MVENIQMKFYYNINEMDQYIYLYIVLHSRSTIATTGVCFPLSVRIWDHLGLIWKFQIRPKSKWLHNDQ